MEGLLRTERKQEGDRVTLALIGEMDLSNAADVIDEFTATVAGRPKSLDVDLSDLIYSDSVGLSALATAHYQCFDHGIAFRILNPNAFVERLLCATGLNGLLRIVSCEDTFVGR
jgi:anti-sigma B factor antagonist